MNSDNDTRKQFIDGLRAVADFYECHSDAYYDERPITFSMYAWGSNAKKTIAATAKTFGHCDKLYSEAHVAISKAFPGNIRVEIFAARATVCRRVISSSTVEPARILPAIEEIRIPERHVDVVEWRCEPLLGAQS